MKDTRLFIPFMPKRVSLNLKNRIAKVLSNTNSCLWFPQLTCELAQTGWQRLGDNTDITESNYGTMRVMLKDSNAPRDVAHSLLFKNQTDEINGIISVEMLSKNIADSYKESGVNFYTLEELFIVETPNEMLDSLGDAFDIISKIPSLFATVITLVKSVHLIKPEFDDYDVSFSEPNIPFSIFVSLPQQNNEINVLRVAEAIIHETMHLQLTLIQQLTQIFIDNKTQYFSPWKEEFRNPEGILHALYVFRIIEEFFKKYSHNRNFNAKLLNHLQTRQREIEKQISEIESFALCPDLTNVGRNFTKRLLYRPIVSCPDHL